MIIAAKGARFSGTGDIETEAEGYEGWHRIL